MKYKVLIIGYGSIGKRHYDVLNTFNTIKQIDTTHSNKHISPWN
jgi:lactate dehydrogenase-like 2-hydroxyacid dehydrogenase